MAIEVGMKTRQATWTAVLGLLLGFGVGAPAAEHAAKTAPADAPNQSQKAEASGHGSEAGHGAGAGHEATSGHGEEGAGHTHATLRGKPGGKLLYFDPYLAVWTLIVFLGVMYLLNKYAWKPILGAFEDREHRVAAALAEAKKLQTEAAQLLEHHDEVLAEAHEQSKHILEQARAEAARQSDAIVAQAKSEAAETQRHAQQEIDAARVAALAELETSASRLAAEIAGKVADRPFRADDFRHLLKETAP
jgi:F-type H+-transporting ATPase subunit b